MRALANREVGDYVNEHFVCSFQKIGTFTVVERGAKIVKQGGNVATYFCLPDGRVLHAIAGPVKADAFLREARWVIDNRKNALAFHRDDAEDYKRFFAKMHDERLNPHNARINQRFHKRPAFNTQRVVNAPATDDVKAFANTTLAMSGLNNQSKVHLLLSKYPLVKLDKIYEVVFENILGEKVSTLPVNGS